MFNISRLEQARKRRRYTQKILAERANISTVTLSHIITGKHSADPHTIKKLVAVLDYPPAFFLQDNVEQIQVSAASFRSLKATTAQERDAALAAGSIAYEMADWVRKRFNLPISNLTDCGQYYTPDAAATVLRQHWAIGERPIANMLKLLEAQGIRVFSLKETTKNIDAFSCWRGSEPYIFLNTVKSSEQSRLDAAHELGHLVLHRHGGPQGREAELEANEFALSFMMPHADVLATISYVTNLNEIVKASKRWGVSFAALNYRLHKMEIITDWQYRAYGTEMRQKYQNSEPDGLPRERSTIWQMVMTELWKCGITRDHIATDLNMPPKEIEGLLFGLTEIVNAPRSTDAPKLRSVK